LRSGFIDPKAPPTVSEPRPTTKEEFDRLLAQLDEIRRSIEAAQERMAAEDAAAEARERKAADAAAGKADEE
jgi:hypothetical protein